VVLNSGIEPDRRITVVEIVRSAQYGGVENHVYALLKHMDPRKYRALLVSLSNAPVHDQFTKLGIETIVLNDRVDSSYRSFLTVMPLARVLRKIRPDVVHLHGIRPIFIGSLAARLAGVKRIISTLHGSYRLMSMDGQGKENAFLLALSKLMHLAGFSLSTHIIADANSLQDEIKEMFRLVPFYRSSSLEKKMETIYNGIDVDEFKDLGDGHALRDKLGIPRDRFVFGTISRLDEPKKGIAVFLRAAHRLLQEGHSAHFLITGEGYSKQPLLKLANELGLGVKVTFLGYWDNLKEVLAALDVFVLPSFSEGFPIVNLEAMAAGLPVISTDVGGVSEGIVHNSNGVLVPPNNEKEMARAMTFLIEHPEIAKNMGEKGKVRVETEFTISIMTSSVLSLYRM
jgi:glycosyltransferase involved in cell wall biosynthesis